MLLSGFDWRYEMFMLPMPSSYIYFVVSKVNSVVS
jgi:hypothetical protein